MANHKEYYAEDLEKLKNRVNKCDTQTLDSLVFFMQEADAHMAGISSDIVEEIKDEVKRYKKDCFCKKRYP